MFTVLLTPGPVTDYESARGSDLGAFATLHRGLLEGGLYLPPSQFEALFLSTAHGEAEMNRLASGLRTGIERIIESR